MTKSSKKFLFSDCHAAVVYFIDIFQKWQDSLRQRCDTHLLAKDGILLQAGFGEVVSLIDVKAAVYFNSGWSPFVGVRRTGTAASCLPTQPVPSATWWLQESKNLKVIEL